jgi:hypothetical protein
MFAEMCCMGARLLDGTITCGEIGCRTSTDIDRLAALSKRLAVYLAKAVAAAREAWKGREEHRNFMDVRAIF